MEPFILYQALICLIVAIPCTATGFLLGLHHAQRKAELKPANERDTAVQCVMLKDFITRFKNARKVVHQIRAGEWTPRYNPLSREHLVAEREDLELWVGNGPFHCEVSGHDCFGLLWRHYVWWAAASKLKKDADKAVKEGPLVL